MRGMRGRWRRGALILAAAAAVAPVHALEAPGIEALAQLEPGMWRIRILDAPVDGREICIGDPVRLAQIDHRGTPCAREIVESGPRGGTVRYTCRGRGFGHSILRVETPRLVRIHTQGINGPQPFSYRAEARRVGPCQGPNLR